MVLNCSSKIVNDCLSVGNVTCIGDYAFDDCNSLTTVTIPKSVTSIGFGVFWGCWDLTEIDVESANTNYTSENGVLFNKDKTTIVCYPEGKAGTTYTIPSSVKSIGDYAFYYCDSLATVTIPESVTSIGEGAFMGCSGLTSVSIPNSVTTIGNSAFADCSGLKSVTIPSSVTTIGYGAFEGCSSLTAVTIPSSVTIIGNGAFADCSGLTSITIPNSVTEIGDHAFYNCSGLTSVTIPDSVEYIGVCAFEGCSSATIYCEFESRPEDWHYDWSGRGCTVVWKYKSTENQGGNEQGGENPGGNENNPTTAVAENAANAVNIYAYGKNIVVENAAEEISVYDAMGRLVCRDVACRARTININGTGIYIVKVGNIAKRVAIN